MSNFVATYDACVLYPAPLRDLLMLPTLSRLYRARWTSRIHDGWMNALLTKRLDSTRKQLEWTRDQMNLAVEDCLVSGYEHLEAGLNLPDPGDCHVLAAAILCQAGTIVTVNLKHFPDAVLAPYDICAQHPDQFIEHAFDLNQVAVCKAVRDQRASLKSLPLKRLKICLTSIWSEAWRPRRRVDALRGLAVTARI